MHFRCLLLLALAAAALPPTRADFGEDKWRYVLEDLAKTPRKPTLDGEPTYENTPQGLHDAKQPYWSADTRLAASWFNPRTGETNSAGAHPGSGSITFDPPGDPAPGNDWVLVLDDATRNFKAAGTL